MVPQAGMNGYATITLTIIGGVLSKTGILFDAETIVDSLHVVKIIGEFVIQNTADTIMLTQKKYQ